MSVAVKHVGCVMNDWRKHQAECGAGESMYAHREQRRNPHDSTVFTLFPPRPQSYRDTGLSSRGSDLLGLQVQGFCCPLRQRPSSGRVTQRVTPRSREEVDISLTLLSSLKGRTGSRGKPVPQSSSASRPEMTPKGGAPTVSHHGDPGSETAETATTPCNSNMQACHGHPSTTKVSELHLYLPTTLCDEEEQDAEAEEMRTSAEGTSTQESEVKLNNASLLVFPNPSGTNQDHPKEGPSNPRLTI